MKIITPDCEYQHDIGAYKEKMKHLPKGSRVLIKRSDPAGISEALIGNWELGLVSISVEPYFTPKSIMDFIEQDCSPHAIINCTDNDDIFEFIDGGELSPEGDHAIFYTSGTTGKPKGVVQTRKGMEHNARATASLHGFDSNSVHLTALPLYHCNAAAMSLFGNYFVNGTAVFLKKFTPESYFGYAEKYKATTANLVPRMVADLIDAKLPMPDCLNYVLTAATALSQELAAGFYNLYGNRLRQGYGMSEAVNFSFTMPMLVDHMFKKHYVDSYPPVGLPVGGQEFRIVGGEVQVKGENLMRCYWNREEETECAFDGEWLRTGDRGELRGEYLVLTGRFKEIIIKNGENYSPVMIEDEYRRAGVKGDLAVVACKDKRAGEDIALVCEEYQPIEMDNPKLQPAAVRYGEVKRTQTKKPQRLAMSKGLVSKALPSGGYEGTLAAAGRIAKQILHEEPVNPQQYYLHNQAIKLAKYSAVGEPYDSVKPYFDVIQKKLHHWWNLGSINHIFKGLSWEELMVDSPMGEFPKLADEFCRENKLYKGMVLEIGAGVGNFSRLVPKHVNYTRSDISKKFLIGKYENEIDLDICSEYPVSGFDLIVGVNVMHCAMDKRESIRHAYNALKEGGVLLLAEGQNPGEAWALDLLFGFIDGWWDLGGFINRQEWLEIMQEFNPAETGYSVYREGKYDLGGLIWMKK